MSSKQSDNTNVLLSLNGLIGRLRRDSVDAVLNDYDKQSELMKDNELFNRFKSFFSANQHLLKKEERAGKADKLLFQLAYEEGEGSSISEQAEDLIKKEAVDWPWMKQLNRKKGSGKNPNYKTLTEHTDSIMGIKLLNPDKLLTWTHHGKLRIWNLNDFRSVELTGSTSVMTDFEEPGWTKSPFIFTRATGNSLVAVHFFSEKKMLMMSNLYMRLWDLQSGNSKIFFIDENKYDDFFFPDKEDFESDVTFLIQSEILVKYQDYITKWNLVDGTMEIIWEREMGRHADTIIDHLNDSFFVNQIWKELNFYLACGINENDVINYIDEKIQYVSKGLDESLIALKVSAKVNSKIYSTIEKKGFESIKFISSDKLITWSCNNVNHYVFDLWNVANGEIEKSLKFDRGASKHPSSRLNYVCEINSAYFFHSASFNRVIKINFNNRTVEEYCLEHSFPVVDILYNYEIGIVSWSEDTTIQISNFSTGKTRVFNGHIKKVNDVIHFKEKKYISYSDDGTIRFWDFDVVAEREFEFLNSERESPFDIIDFLSIDEYRLVSWTGNNITFWDLSAGTDSVFKLAGTSNVVQLNSEELIVVNKQSSVTILNIVSGKQKKLEGHKATILDLLLINNNKALLSWSEDGTIKLWDLKTTECLMTYVFEGVEKVFKISDSKYMCISSNKKYRILELENF